jgi:uncharacterized protein YprB with RNaseH-like and TPR domain
MSRLLHRLQRTLNGRKETFDEATTSASMGADLEASRFLRERLNASGSRVERLDELDGATTQETPHGACVQFVSRHPLNTMHGSMPLLGTYTADCSRFNSLVGDDKLRTLVLSKSLFLDIEATGLDHGAGTFAFMIGLGFVEDDYFVIKQLFLPDIHQEQAMLFVLKEHLDNFDTLISFNGKSYDLTVLQSRMVIQRMYTADECNLKLQPHLDLLHLSRNIYRGIYENTRLPTLERGLLGFTRVDDVPSSLVPTMWYEFLRSRNAYPIRLVAEHNLYDVLSMVTLTGALARDTQIIPTEQPRQAHIALNLGRVWLRRKQYEQAIEALEAAHSSLLDDACKAEKHRLLSTTYGRVKRYQKQGIAIRDWCAASPTECKAWIANSIHQERRQKDLPGALSSARQAEILESSPANQRRINRLELRLTRRP